MSRSEVLLMVGGSIAAYKTCHLVSRLTQAGHGVQVVASPAALKFVGAATWEGLSGRPVVNDLFEPGRAMDHIHLVRRADVIVAAPASAHFINRIANGVGDDLMTTMFLAHDFKKPFMIAPAMNTSMYLHPATQASLKKLRDMGVEILEAASGVLACGETGYGKLLDPELLLKEVERALARSSPQTGVSAETAARPSKTGAKILITAGGTREPIDDVRVISNTSTGRSGVQLAEALSALGMPVTLLRATSAPRPNDAEIPTKDFDSSDDLGNALRDLLPGGGFTHVIQMAAVSDYVVERVTVNGQSPARGKIPSGEHVTLELKPTPKLIANLKNYDPRLKVAGFKLTSGASNDDRRAAAAKVLAFADIVIGNDLSEIDDAKGVHPYSFYTQTTQEPLAGFAEMAARLARWISETSKKENA